MFFFENCVKLFFFLYLLVCNCLLTKFLISLKKLTMYTYIVFYTVLIIFMKSLNCFRIIAQIKRYNLRGDQYF